MPGHAEPPTPRGVSFSQSTKRRHRPPKRSREPEPRPLNRTDQETVATDQPDFPCPADGVRGLRLGIGVRHCAWQVLRRVGHGGARLAAAVAAVLRHGESDPSPLPAPCVARASAPHPRGFTCHISAHLRIWLAGLVCVRSQWWQHAGWASQATLQVAWPARWLGVWPAGLGNLPGNPQQQLRAQAAIILGISTASMSCSLCGEWAQP